MKLKKDEVLVLRDVNADMTAHNGFVWPEKGYVEAPDWDGKPECGGGLHGNSWGTGGDYFISSGAGKYLVVCVNTADMVDLGDKVKFRCGKVVYCGDLVGAVELIAKHAPINTAINYSTQTAGYGSTQTAGGKSTQTAGNYSTQKAGDYSTQKAGYDSTQKAGYDSTQKAGYDSTQTAGGKSTQTAGGKSTQKAGNYSTQTAGYDSTQTAGNYSTQTAGNDSTQTAGLGSVQIQQWFDGEWRTACRVVTEKEANKPYKCESGQWVEVMG